MSRLHSFQILGFFMSILVAFRSSIPSPFAAADVLSSGQLEARVEPEDIQCKEFLV